MIGYRELGLLQMGRGPRLEAQEKEEWEEEKQNGPAMPQKMHVHSCALYTHSRRSFQALFLEPRLSDCDPSRDQVWNFPLVCCRGLPHSKQLRSTTVSGFGVRGVRPKSHFHQAE